MVSQSVTRQCTTGGVFPTVPPRSGSVAAPQVSEVKNFRQDHLTTWPRPLGHAGRQAHHGLPRGGGGGKRANSSASIALVRSAVRFTNQDQPIVPLQAQVDDKRLRQDSSGGKARDDCNVTRDQRGWRHTSQHNGL